MEEIRNSVALNAEAQALKTHKITEIEKRLAEHQANPQDIVPWSTVKTHLQIAQ